MHSSRSIDTDPRVSCAWKREPHGRLGAGSTLVDGSCRRHVGGGGDRVTSHATDRAACPPAAALSLVCPSNATPVPAAALQRSHPCRPPPGRALLRSKALQAAQRGEPSRAWPAAGRQWGRRRHRRSPPVLPPPPLSAAAASLRRRRSDRQPWHRMQRQRGRRPRRRQQQRSTSQAWRSLRRPTSRKPLCCACLMICSFQSSKA